MKRQQIISLVLALLAFIVPLSSAVAESNEVRIFPLNDGEYWVHSNQNIVLRYGWAAISPGLVKHYMKSVDISFDLSIEDQTILTVSSEEASEYWGDITGYSISPEWPCPPTKAGSVAYWTYDLGTLEPGDYVLSFSRDLDSPLRDPCDLDGDGRPDIYYGGSAQIAIRVQED
jgi:hypothetical protein